MAVAYNYTEEFYLATNTDIPQSAATISMADGEYQRMIELAPMPIAVHMQGTLVYANRATAKLMHVDSPEHLVGRNIMEFVHPDSRELVKQRVALIYKEGMHETSVVREKFICDDGETIEVEIASMLFHYQGQVAIQLIVRDITEQVKAQAAIAESEQRFRQLADSMPQMVWTADPDGTVTYRNRRWFDYTGFTSEVDMETWHTFLHPDDRERALLPWEQAVKTGRTYQAEFRLQDIHRPGRYRWFLGRAVPIVDDEGVITKWFGTSTDITDLRRTSQRKKELEHVTVALTAQRSELVALNKAKDEFISLASHQLRTPATGVKQFIGMVLEGYAGDISPEARTFLEKAYESNDRQIAIINDLLQVAQIDAGKVSLHIQPTNINDIIQSVIQEQQSKFDERRQTIHYSPAKRPLNALADPERLRMVLDNLIDNASKYTPEGKSITIAASGKNDTVVITVQDEGVGIDPIDHDKIFLKFTRLDNPLSNHVGGSGLGLYWVRKIIALHGGTVTVNSTVGEGATFTVSLPKA